MRVSNAIYKTIRLQGTTFPMKAGTPVSQYGSEENGAGAIGILTEDIVSAPIFNEVRVLVGGDIDQDEAEHLYGTPYTTACKTAMDGLRIREADGTIYSPAGGSTLCLHKMKLSVVDRISEEDPYQEYNVMLYFYSSHLTPVKSFNDLKLYSNGLIAATGGSVYDEGMDMYEHAFGSGRIDDTHNQIMMTFHNDMDGFHDGSIPGRLITAANVTDMISEV